MRISQPKGWRLQRLAAVAVMMPWAEAEKRTTAFDDCRQFLSGHKRWNHFPKTYQGFVKALRHNHAPLAEAVWMQFQKRTQELAGPHWRWSQWVPVAVDGSRLECPRSPANEEALGCAGKPNTSPQIQVTELWHMPTALPWSAAFGPGTDSEQLAFRTLIGGLPPQSLVVADAGFFSYETARRLIAEGHAFLIRVGANKTLLTELFGECHYEFGPHQQVYAWSSEAQKAGRPPLSLRLIEIETDAPQEPNVFLLTGLSAGDLSDQQAGTWYAKRWGVAEVGYRTQKQTLDAAKLRSRVPQLALCEAEWVVLSTFLLGALALQHRPRRTRRTQAAREAAREAARDDWSPALTLEVVRRRIKNHSRSGGRWSKRIAGELKACRIDRGPRSGPKSPRPHPKKKTQSPPRPPKVRPASASERKAALAFESTIIQV